MSTVVLRCPFSVLRRTENGELRTENRQPTFDLPPSPLCLADPEPAAGRIVVRGSKAGGLTMHLRAIDLADLFFVLHDQTGASFIVDPDVKGSVDVEVENATLDDVLAAIRDVTIGAGPLRRISRANPQAPQSKDYSGEPVSIILAEADLRDILCLYETITGLKFLASPSLSVRANVFVRERPWDEILDVLFAGARVRYRIDGDRVLVGENATVSTCESRPRSFTNSRLELAALGADDLIIAGVAGAKAYAYGPWRRVVVLEKDTRLFDGVVESVERTGVRFGK